MKMDVFIFLLLIVLSILLSIGIAYVSFKKRNAPGAIYLALMEISCIIWSIGYIVESLGFTLAEKMIGVKIQYFFGISFTPILWMLAILHFTSLKKHPTKLVVFLVSIVPAITMLLAQFMESHSYFYQNTKLVQYGSFLLIEKDWGWWFYCHVIYSYIFNLIGTILLIKSIRKKEFIFKKQTVIWLLAIIIPWTVNILYVFGMSSFMKLDFTNAAFSISAALLSIAINKFDLFNLIPAAHDIVINSMSNGLIVIDNMDRVVEANPSAHKIFKRKELVGLSKKELFKGIEFLWDIDESKEAEIYELEIDNSIYELLITDVIDKNKEHNGSIYNFYDITDRKKTEKALHESNAAKDKFFSIIAHDLRNPLSGIHGLSKLLTDPGEHIKDNERNEIMKEIKELSSNTFKMLENLLEWSRSQTGRIEYYPEKYDITESINESIFQLKNSAEIKKISLSSNIKEPHIIFADRNMIDTVVRNLISNAIKFTPQTGSIMISAIMNGDKIEISVKDTGVGMDKKSVEEVFNLDKRNNTVGTAGERGTGLGLILCREFVERNRGKIWTTSEIGKGSTFSFSLPQAN